MPKTNWLTIKTQVDRDRWAWVSAEVVRRGKERIGVEKRHVMNAAIGLAQAVTEVVTPKRFKAMCACLNSPDNAVDAAVGMGAFEQLLNLVCRYNAELTKGAVE